VMSTMVRHRETGLHFRPGDVDDLVAQVRWARSHPTELAEIGRAARREFEAQYTAERNHKMLIDIYQTAVERARR
jgi:glycosyltransferase involved in cell wall biosynthesis